MDWDDQLDRAIRQTVRRVAHWIETRDNKPGVHLHLTRENQLRLLTLKTWSLRYHLSIEEILDMVMKPLRRQVQRRPGNTGKMMLGVSVRTMTGSAAERIILEKIERRYPGNEHLTMWRMSECRRQLAREAKAAGEDDERRVPTLLDAPDVATYVKRYRQRVIAAREQLKNEETEEWRRRKPYRYNPWR